MSHPLKRKESVLKKMLPPNGMSIPELSKQESIPEGTLYTWRKQWQLSGFLVADSKKTQAENWSSSDKFAAVIETASKNQAELSAWCRERGIYPEQLEQWRLACTQANDWQNAQQKSEKQQQKEDKIKIASLEKELTRKEKALAEAAALLVLRKKACAIWGEQEDE
jgi:transposase-like protein